MNPNPRTPDPIRRNRICTTRVCFRVGQNSTVPIPVSMFIDRLPIVAPEIAKQLDLSNGGALIQAISFEALPAITDSDRDWGGDEAMRSWNEDPNAHFSLLFVPFLPTVSCEDDVLSFIKEVYGPTITRTDDHRIILNDTYYIEVVIPNFFLRPHSQNTHVPTGGPGGIPRPASKAEYVEMVAKDQSWMEAIRLQDRNPPCVYVLDTWYPKKETLEKGKLDPTIKTEEMAGEHPKLGEWIKNTKIETHPLSAPYFDDFHKARPYAPNPASPDDQDVLDNRIVVDHGAFVADTIHRFAPKAFAERNVTIMETMNAYGVGTLESVAVMIAKLYKLLKESTVPNLINMSFTFDVPDFGHGVDKWEATVKKHIKELYPASRWTRWREDMQVELNKFRTKWEFLNQLCGGDYSGLLEKLLIHLVRVLRDTPHPRKTYIVAAVGNDSDKKYGDHLKAAYPADVAWVLGVAAVEDIGADAPLTDYTNLDDGAPDRGEREFGGTREEQNHPKGELDEFWHVTKTGIVGPYIQNNFPPFLEREDVRNIEFAHWCGTSFATGRVTGKLVTLITKGHVIETALRYVANNP